MKLKEVLKLFSLISSYHNQVQLVNNLIRFCNSHVLQEFLCLLRDELPLTLFLLELLLKYPQSHQCKDYLLHFGLVFQLIEDISIYHVYALYES